MEPKETCQQTDQGGQENQGPHKIGGVSLPTAFSKTAKTEYAWLPFAPHCRSRHIEGGRGRGEQR